MANQQQAIIIRKKKKGGHGGHHGGAWKVAYADFVTAMMAFFLMLWLLQTTTSDQRRGLADYFAPASVSDSNSGAGGAMGGMTLTVAEGAQASSVSPPAGEEEVTPTVGADDHAGEAAGDGDKANVGKGDKPKAGKSDKGELEALGAAMDGDVSVPKNYKEIAEAIQKEEGQFKGAEEALKTAIAENVELSEFADQILIDRTSEGLRIQIVDKERYSMFPSGSAIPYERARDLLRLVGKIIAKLPNKISVTGHTDSAPFAAGSRRDNWGLSMDRANTSRMEMIAAGVPEGRVARMVGMSDREPLVANDPKNTKNRRISIVLLRQATGGSGH